MGFKPAALLKMNFFTDFLENFVEDCMFSVNPHSTL